MAEEIIIPADLRKSFNPNSFKRTTKVAIHGKNIVKTMLPMTICLAVMGDNASMPRAVPIILAAVLVINVLFVMGVFDYIANFAAPVITGILGLPKESVTAIIIGFLRKDAAQQENLVFSSPVSEILSATVVSGREEFRLKVQDSILSSCDSG